MLDGHGEVAAPAVVVALDASAVAPAEVTPPAPVMPLRPGQCLFGAHLHAVCLPTAYPLTGRPRHPLGTMERSRRRRRAIQRGASFRSVMKTIDSLVSTTRRALRSRQRGSCYAICGALGGSTAARRPKKDHRWNLRYDMGEVIV